MKLVVDVEKN